MGHREKSKKGGEKTTKEKTKRMGRRTGAVPFRHWRCLDESKVGAEPDHGVGVIILASPYLRHNVAVHTDSAVVTRAVRHH